MFCPKCGDSVEKDEKFCNKCGNFLQNSNFDNSINNYSPNYSKNVSNKSNNNLIIIGGTVIIVFLVVVLLFAINSKKGKYYFSNNDYYVDEQTVEKTSDTKRDKYSTVIITDNYYTGVKIETTKDAYDLISKDSVSQKNKCPVEIQKVENELIEKYGVTAVNLCEMDLDFANEILNVFKKIYNEYPGVRNNLTNLTLENTPASYGYIAAFQAVSFFASSDSKTGYPEVLKTQILLNTKYFLNPLKLESDVQVASKSGHFPPNVTKYSPVAHELGHYLSFLAMMRSYDVETILLLDNTNLDVFSKIFQDFADGNFSLAMIEEAYNNYKNDTNTTLTIEEWRGTISSYALARDNSGNYIYDETIAEAFHDVYLNDESATDASKYIIKVLKNKLGGE